MPRFLVPSALQAPCKGRVPMFLQLAGPSLGRRALLPQCRPGGKPPSWSSTGGVNTVCMAAPRRVARVAKQLGREVGNLLLTDKVLQAAVCPERRLGLDSSLSAVASVSDVELSTDLQVAKVYISVYSDERGKEAAMRGLARLEGYVRKKIAAAMELRAVPEIRFIQDESIQRSEQVLALLDQIRAGTAPVAPLALPDISGDADDYDELFWEEGQPVAESATDGTASQEADGFLDLDSEQDTSSRGRAVSNGTDAASEDDSDGELEEEEGADEAPHAAHAGPQISRSLAVDENDFLDFGEEEGPPVYMTAQPGGSTRSRPRARSGNKKAAGKAAGKRRVSRK